MMYNAEMDLRTRLTDSDFVMCTYVRQRITLKRAWRIVSYSNVHVLKLMRRRIYHCHYILGVNSPFNSAVTIRGITSTRDQTLKGSENSPFPRSY